MNVFLCKGIIIGEPCTGKTSLLCRYTKNIFNPEYTCTIGVDFQVKQLRLKEGVLKLQLWDTAGQEKYRILTTSYFKGSRVCLVLYDITRRTTFDKVSEWVNQFNKNQSTTENVLVIIGNKNDLNDSRQVKFEEGVELAKSNNCLFFETSVKTNPEGINQLFDVVAEKAFALLKKDAEQNKSDNSDVIHLEKLENHEIKEQNECQCLTI